MGKSSDAEKKAWAQRKANYLKARARHGCCVNKPRVIQRLSAHTPAPDPTPITRQVARANDRRRTKMPLGLTAEKWHRQNDMPKNVKRRG